MSAVCLLTKMMGGTTRMCTFSFLFLVITDFIMKKSLNNPVFGITWKHDRLTDLDFADDIVLLSDARNSK